MEELIRAVTTCHTEGCVLADQELEITFVGVLVCGGCDVEVTDIVPVDSTE